MKKLSLILGLAFALDLSAAHPARPRNPGPRRHDPRFPKPPKPPGPRRHDPRFPKPPKPPAPRRHEPVFSREANRSHLVYTRCEGRIRPEDGCHCLAWYRSDVTLAQTLRADAIWREAEQQSSPLSASERAQYMRMIDEEIFRILGSVQREDYRQVMTRCTTGSF